MQIFAAATPRTDRNRESYSFSLSGLISIISPHFLQTIRPRHRSPLALFSTCAVNSFDHNSFSAPHLEHFTRATDFFSYESVVTLLTRSTEPCRTYPPDLMGISIDGFFSCHLPDPDRDAACDDQEGNQEKNNGDHPLLLAGQVQPCHRDFLFTHKNPVVRL